jgi:hypothetical protein
MMGVTLPNAGEPVQIDYLEPTDGAYRAGVCNLGSREIARRRTFGLLGIGFTIVVAAVLVAIGAPPLVRAIIFFPLFGSLVSLEEARRRFCGAFAFLGIRSVAGADATERVADTRDRSTDRAAARRLVAYCGAIASAATAAFIILPSWPT